MKEDFYVYVYSDPTTDIPFYVGKGRGSRAWAHFRPSSLANTTFFYNKLRAMLSKGSRPVIRKLEENLCEEEACNCERFYIAALGRRTSSDNPGPLCNLTDGGEGLVGLARTCEHCRKISESRRGQRLTDATKLKLSKAHTGKKATPATRQKMSEALRNRWTSEARSRASQLRTGRRHSDATKKKISDAARQRQAQKIAKV